MTRPVDPALAARLLRELRRRSRPVTGRTLARRFGEHKRRIEEAIHSARCKGHRIVSGPRGYELTRSTAKVESFVRREERRIQRELRALRGVRRGRVAQGQIPTTRRKAA